MSTTQKTGACLANLPSNYGTNGSEMWSCWCLLKSNSYTPWWWPLSGGIDRCAESSQTHRGTWGPPPTATSGQILGLVKHVLVDVTFCHLHWRRLKKLTPGGLPANSGTAQPDPFLPHSWKWSVQLMGWFVSRLLNVCPRTIRLRWETKFIHHIFIVCINIWCPCHLQCPHFDTTSWTNKSQVRVNIQQNDAMSKATSLHWRCINIQTKQSWAEVSFKSNLRQKGFGALLCGKRDHTVVMHEVLPITVEHQADEEDYEEMVGVPEDLKVRPTDHLHGGTDHEDESQRDHDACQPCNGGERDEGGALQHNRWISKSTVKHAVGHDHRVTPPTPACWLTSFIYQMWVLETFLSLMTQTTGIYKMLVAVY